MAVTLGAANINTLNAMNNNTDDDYFGDIATVGQTSTAFNVGDTDGTSVIYKSAGGGGLGYGGKYNAALNYNVSKRHLFFWVKFLDVVQDEGATNGGYRCRLTDNSMSSPSVWGDWEIGGQDTRRVVVNGFVRMAVDTLRPYDWYDTTIPTNKGSIDGIGVGGYFLSASGQNTNFIDNIMTFTGALQVQGGTAVAKGNSSEIATADQTGGYGAVKDIGGIFYILSGVEWGNTAAASYFNDQGETWVFEAQAVSNTFYTLSFVGHSASTNEATFGTSSGTGTSKTGSGGNTFISSGAVPFQVECTDANIPPQFFGCTFQGPPSLREDPVRAFLRFDASGPTYTDDTTNANDVNQASALMFPATEANNDASMFGSDRPFTQLTLDLNPVGVGTPTLALEYSTGATTWSTLPSTTDGTSGLTADGTIDWTIPDDWTKATYNSESRYWMRIRIVSGTFSTNPQLDEVTVAQGVQVDLDTSTTEAIGCRFLNTEVIRPRNGAFLKKSVIDGSNATAKNGALDLGGADPTADTIRELTISNCSRGILLRGSGNTTYNFRDIKFTGNTFDLRVDFGATDTVTINILEDGDTPTYEKVLAGTTVTINNNKNVTFSGLKDNTEVRVYNAGTTTEIAGIENATAGTPDNRSFTWSAAATTSVDYVIHNVEYEYIRVEGYVVGSTDATIPIQQRFDRNYSNP